jgi:hypothetical protein
MRAALHDLYIEQSVALTEYFQWLDSNENPHDLTDATYTGSLKYSKDRSDTIISLTLTTVNASLGVFRVSISSDDTVGLDFNSAVYAIYITLSGSTKKRVVEGNAYLSKA